MQNTRKVKVAGDPFHNVKRVDRHSTAVPSCLKGLFALHCRNHKPAPHFDLASDKRNYLSFRGGSGELSTRGSSVIAGQRLIVCQIHFREELPTRDDQLLHCQVKLVMEKCKEPDNRSPFPSNIMALVIILFFCRVQFVTFFSCHRRDASQYFLRSPCAVFHEFRTSRQGCNFQEQCSRGARRSSCRVGERWKRQGQQGNVDYESHDPPCAPGYGQISRFGNECMETIISLKFLLVLTKVDRHTWTWAVRKPSLPRSYWLHDCSKGWIKRACDEVVEQWRIGRECFPITTNRFNNRSGQRQPNWKAP